LYQEKIKVAECIQRTIVILQPNAEKKNIKITNHTADNLWVKSDRDQLVEIFTNLIENAIKYSPEGTTISIQSEYDTHSSLPGSGTDVERTVVISVIDQGFGIPAQNLESLFDRFARIKQKDKTESGLGLGLHIVKKFIDLNGGSIQVDSKVGVGSTFNISLPGGEFTNHA